MKFFKFTVILILQNNINYMWAGYIADKVDAKTVKMSRFAQCQGTNLPLKFFVQTGKWNIPRAVIRNTTITARENLKDGLKVSLSIDRCRSRENLDSCEDYHKIPNLDYCQGISQDMLFSGVSNPLSMPFEPKLKCPIKKGNYRALNFTFNFAPFLVFNLDGWYWKTKLEVFSPKENNRPIGCANIELYTLI